MYAPWKSGMQVFITVPLWRRCTSGDCFSWRGAVTQVCKKLSSHSLPRGSGTIKRNACPCGHLRRAGSGQTQIRVWIGGGWHAVIISRCWNWPAINPGGQEDQGWPTQLLSETRFLWFNDLEKNEKNVSSVSNVRAHALWFRFSNTWGRGEKVPPSQKYNHQHICSHTHMATLWDNHLTFHGSLWSPSLPFLALSSPSSSPHAACSGPKPKSIQQTESQERCREENEWGKGERRGEIVSKSTFFLLSAIWKWKGR